MKKLSLAVLTVVFTVLCAFKMNAQAFEQGRSYVNVGYGYAIFQPTTIINAFDNESSSSNIGPVRFAYEYGLSENVGVGFTVGYINSKVGFEDENFGGTDPSTFTYDYTFTKLTTNLRFNFHFGEHDKLDPYIGVGAGYKISNLTLETNDEFFDDADGGRIGVPISFESVFGIRYFFTDNIGAYGEVGIGNGAIHGGLIAKF